MLQNRLENGTRWMAFDRPARLNSFSAADYRDLRLALEAAAADPATKVVVLTGNGRAFSAGADLSLLDGTSASEDRIQAGEEFTGLLEILAVFEKPLLAAVNGYAIGIGATILLYCDLVLVAESARLRLPFTAMGLVPEAGSSALLLARTRSPDALWAMLSSEWIDAGMAQRMGLAWRVVPDARLLDETADAAAILAVLDPISVTATKRLLTTGRADTARHAIQRELDEMRAFPPRAEL
ncbi:enoyl-CoA hydratase/isomerase family protein [Frankia sp. Cpl3]|nr:enoyl-CoA hydratase/isomerase family protein [Frankia sp. Cpl3]